MNSRRDIGVACQIGSYHDAVEVPSRQRWLLTSGTPGLALDGALPPDIRGQAEPACTHILGAVRPASMLRVVPALVGLDILLEGGIVAPA